MYKRTLAIIIMIISIGLIGCSNQATPKNEDTSNKSNVEQVQPQVSEEIKKEISLDEAKEIALKDANISGDSVTFIKGELDFDNGVRKYDIEFFYENKEYDYEISATDGKIISSSVENHDIQLQQPQEPQQSQQSQQSQQPQVSQEIRNEISVNEAKEIALKHANLTNNNVKFIKAELDVDDGVRKYEIDFYYNNKEYDYEINADTGSIISFEIDQ